jgi:general secretion pathway protein D
MGILLIGSVQAAPILSIQPSPLSVGAGQSFGLDVDIADAADLYAFQFDLGFNPNVISGVSVTEGSFLPSGGTTVFTPGTIDNIGGTITFNSDSLLGAIPGVTGNGTLATVEFSAISGGSSSVNLANVILLDSTLNTIATNVASGIVNVQAIPEPGGLGLVLICLAGLGIRFRSGTV